MINKRNSLSEELAACKFQIGRQFRRMKSLEAVLFDFDGTMVDTEWIIYEEVQRIFHSEGQELPLEQYSKCIGSSYETWSPQTYLEELTGKSYDWETLRAARNVRIRERMEAQELISGVQEALDFTQQCGLRLGVVSSSSHDWVDRWIEKLGIGHYFEHVTCRGDAPRIKPAPDLFLKGAERMEIDPSRCLVVEDSRNGMLAAHEAGMSVFAVPNRVTVVSDFSEALQKLGSMLEYPEALEKLVK